MKNRNLMVHKIEQIENRLKTLRHLVTNQSDVKDFLIQLEDSEEILSDIKSMIEREPIAVS